MAKKKTVEEQIEELARMVKLGFDGTATKEGLEQMATRQQLQLVVDNVDLLRADVMILNSRSGRSCDKVLQQSVELTSLKSASAAWRRKLGSLNV